MYSLPGVDESSTSAPARSRLLGRIERFSTRVSSATSCALLFWERTLELVEGRVAFSSPSPVVAFPCGSRSTRSVFLRRWARAAATFTDVVVLPVPALLFKTPMFIFLPLWILDDY